MYTSMISIHPKKAQANLSNYEVNRDCPSSQKKPTVAPYGSVDVIC